MKSWKILSSQIIHKNPRFSVREDKVIRNDGRNRVYYVIDKPSCVAIIALTKKQEIFLIHQARYTTRKSHWEIPIGSSDDQDELVAAKRELHEETGLISSDWVKLGKVEVAPGMTGQMMHVFVARNLTETSENEQAEEGIDKMRKIPLKKVLEMVEKNEIVDGPTIAAFMLTVLKLKRFT